MLSIHMFGKMQGYMPRVKTNGKVVLVGPHDLQLPSAKAASAAMYFVKAINQTRFSFLFFSKSIINN